MISDLFTTSSSSHSRLLSRDLSDLKEMLFFPRMSNLSSFRSLCFIREAEGLEFQKSLTEFSNPESSQRREKVQESAAKGEEASYLSPRCLVPRFALEPVKNGTFQKVFMKNKFVFARCASLPKSTLVKTAQGKIN